MNSGPDAGNLEFVDSMPPIEGEIEAEVGLPPAELLVNHQEVSRLIYDPVLEEVRQRGYGVRGFRVTGKVEGNAVAWGFWGAFLMVLILALVVVFRGASGLYSTWDMFWVMVGLTIGALMFKSGKRSSLTRELLCEIDLQQQMMLWPTGGREAMIAVEFAELTELVFGMTYYPISHQRRDVKVHAFTLLARDSQNRLIPIVEASPDKEETHEIAKFIGRNMGLPLTYVGLGIK